MSGLSGLDGNEGNEGNEGNYAPDPMDRLDGSGNGGVLPMRISPKRTPLDGLPQGPSFPLVFAGDRWGTPDPGWADMPAATRFRDADWDPYRWGVLALTEFVQLRAVGGTAPAWEGLLTANDVFKESWTAAELKELNDLVEYRGGVMAEALAQRWNIQGYFARILGFGAGTHRYTFFLCEAAMAVGQFLAMRWKGEWNRPRPSRLDPRLLPPIPVPGHAAYPSGHATQAMLMALLLEQVLPPAILVNTTPTAGADTGPLRTLARRIARNREVLGVHYRSDTFVGQRLAALAFPLLLSCPALRGDASASAPAPAPEPDPRQVAAVTIEPGAVSGSRWEPVPIVFPNIPGGGSSGTPLVFAADGAIARARAEWS